MSLPRRTRLRASAGAAAKDALEGDGAAAAKEERA